MSIEIVSQPQLDWLQKSLEEENSKVGFKVEIVDIYGETGLSGAPIYYAIVIDQRCVAVATLTNGKELYKLYVAPSFRKQGLASRLANHVIPLLIADKGECYIEYTAKSSGFWESFFNKTEKFDGRVDEGAKKITLWDVDKPEKSETFRYLQAYPDLQN